MRHVIIPLIVLLFVPALAAAFEPDMTLKPVADTVTHGEGVSAKVDVSDEVWERDDLDLRKVVKGEDARKMRLREDPGEEIDLGRAQTGHEYGVQVVSLTGSKNREIEEVLQEEMLDIIIKANQSRMDDEGEAGGDDREPVDTKNVRIASINGEDADQVNSLSVTGKEISIRLEGYDTEENSFTVNVGGNTLGRVDEGDTHFRPRSGTELEEGEQTLSVQKRTREGQQTLGETKVDITQVDLARDEGDEGGRAPIETGDVRIASINGEDADQVNSLSVTGKEISIRLEGYDTEENSFTVNVGGNTLGRVDEGDTHFRPRSGTELEEGEQTLSVQKRTREGQQTLGKTKVDITQVDLGRDESTRVEPGSIAIAAIDGEDPERVNNITLLPGDPVHIEMENFDLSEKRTFVRIGDAKLSLTPDHDGELRPRPKDEVKEGEQTLAVLYRIEGELTTIGKTRVNVVEFSGERARGGSPSRDADLSIQSVNGEPAKGTVKLRHDLRGEVPIKMKVAGLSDAEFTPRVQFRNQSLGPGTQEGDTISLHHLPRVEEGEPGKLSLMVRVGDGEKRIFDSVKLTFEHEADATADRQETGKPKGAQSDTNTAPGGKQKHAQGEGIKADDAKKEKGGGFFGSLGGLFGGAEETSQESSSTNETRASQDTPEQSGQSEEGDGMLHSVMNFFGLG